MQKTDTNCYWKLNNSCYDEMSSNVLQTKVNGEGFQKWHTDGVHVTTMGKCQMRVWVRVCVCAYLLCDCVERNLFTLKEIRERDGKKWRNKTRTHANPTHTLTDRFTLLLRANSPILFRFLSSNVSTLFWHSHACVWCVVFGFVRPRARMYECVFVSFNK